MILNVPIAVTCHLCSGSMPGQVLEMLSVFVLIKPFVVVSYSVALPYIEVHLLKCGFSVLNININLPLIVPLALHILCNGVYMKST